MFASSSGSYRDMGSVDPFSISASMFQKNRGHKPMRSVREYCKNDGAKIGGASFTRAKKFTDGPTFGGLVAPLDKDIYGTKREPDKRLIKTESMPNMRKFYDQFSKSFGVAERKDPLHVPASSRTPGVGAYGLPNMSVISKKSALDGIDYCSFAIKSKSSSMFDRKVDVRTKSYLDVEADAQRARGRCVKITEAKYDRATKPIGCGADYFLFPKLVSAPRATVPVFNKGKIDRGTVLHTGSPDGVSYYLFSKPRKAEDDMKSSNVKGTIGQGSRNTSDSINSNHTPDAVGPASYSRDVLKSSSVLRKSHNQKFQH